MSGVLNISDLHWEEDWISTCPGCRSQVSHPSVGYRVCCGVISTVERRRALVTDVGRSGVWDGLFESERTLNE